MPPTGTSRSTGRPSSPSSTSSGPATSPASSSSTRPTSVAAARDAATPAPAVAGCVLVSALTGYGLDPSGRAGGPPRLALGRLDVAVPYAAGELLARVRERGTVELDYQARDVRVTGAWPRPSPASCVAAAPLGGGPGRLRRRANPGVVTGVPGSRAGLGGRARQRPPARRQVGMFPGRPA